jgi:chromate transporter
VARSINVPSLLLTLASVVAIFRFKLGMIPTLLISSAAGIGWYFVMAYI